MSKRRPGAVSVLPWCKGREFKVQSSTFKGRVSENFELGTLNFEPVLDGALLGEGRKIFVTELREGIIQSALGYSQLDAHFCKSNTDGFRIQDRDAHFSF